MTKDTPLPIVERLRAGIPTKFEFIDDKDFVQAKLDMREAADTIQAQHEALELILPLAKGYVAKHKVPSTKGWVASAEAAIAKAKGEV